MLLPLLAQETVRVEMEINLEYKQGPSLESINIAEIELDQQQIVFAPDNLLVGIIASSEVEDAFTIHIDINDNGSLTDDPSMQLSIDSTIVFSVRRSWENKEDKFFRYYLHCSRRLDRSGVQRINLRWRSHYRAEGKLLINGNDYLVAFLDSDGNGKFNKDDFKRMTSFLFDANRDGRIWGKGEHFYGHQILSFENENFLLTELAPDGSHAIFEQTDLIIPKVGEKMPGFELITTRQKMFSDESLLGENYMLDFWASWCAPCVAAFPKLKQLEKKYSDTLQVISINIDTQNRVTKAENIIEKYDLSWPQVFRVKGRKDDLWKQFGSTPEGRFGIPLYVLVDSKGVILYLGKGGKNLEDLEAAVSTL